MPDTTTAESKWSIDEIISTVILSILVPFIIIGNLFVIISVIKFRRLQIPTNYLVLSLAISDLSSGLFIPFLVAVEIKKEVIRNINMCLSAYSMILLGAAVSILTLAAIAFDRYTACVHSMEYIKIVSIRRTIFVIVSIWILSIALTWGMILGQQKTLVWDLPTTYCSFSWIPQMALAVLLGVIFFPACLFIFFCYFRIYLIARHHARAIAAVERSVHMNLQLQYLNKDTKYAKTLGIVIGGFLILTLPFQVAMLVEAVSFMQVNDWLINYLILLSLLNNGINPWVYAFRNGEFRAAFRRLLKSTPFKFKSQSTGRRSSFSSGRGSSIVQLSQANSRIGPDLISMLYRNTDGVVGLGASPPHGHNPQAAPEVVLSPRESLRRTVAVKNMLKANSGAHSLVSMHGNQGRNVTAVSIGNNAVTV